MMKLFNIMRKKCFYLSLVIRDGKINLYLILHSHCTGSVLEFTKRFMRHCGTMRNPSSINLQRYSENLTLDEANNSAFIIVIYTFCVAFAVIDLLRLEAMK